MRPRGSLHLGCRRASRHHKAARRGGRAVEGARLESVYRGNPIAGSNPAPSATFLFVLVQNHLILGESLEFVSRHIRSCSPQSGAYVWVHRWAEGPETGRTLGKLTALDVTRAKVRGYYGDGGGLYLQVSAGGTKSWVFRYRAGGRLREMGLGPLHTISLAEARL
jgi:Arm DNA-binding domain